MELGTTPHLDVSGPVMRLNSDSNKATRRVVYDSKLGESSTSDNVVKEDKCMWN